MTVGERALWIAVFAASWHVPTARSSPGHVTDCDRCQWCSAQADRALAAARALVDSCPVSPLLAEVIG